MQTINSMRLISFITIILCINQCGDDSSSIIPDLSISGTEFVEGDENGKAELVLKLSQSVDRTITYAYTLQDGSARLGDDYSGSEGTVSFNPGESETILHIDLVSDTHIELRESFIATIVNSEDTEKTYTVQVFINDDDTEYTISEDVEGYITPISYPSMELVWSDEFDQQQLNTDNWTYEIGDGCDKGICGWGNEELEDYTDSESNVFINEGKLVIKATEEGQGNYLSGRIITDNKQEFQFGRIDIRAKLPEGQGLWPALWMLGNNIDQVGWPVCGEIDIMEARGQFPNFIQGTIHYDASGYKTTTGSYDLEVGKKFSDKFHVFSLLWDRNKITWYVDYEAYKTINASSIGSGYPFNQDFYFIFNVAVGGLYVGSPDETTVFPQQMEVDYIRVFQ